MPIDLYYFESVLIEIRIRCMYPIDLYLNAHAEIIVTKAGKRFVCPVSVKAL